MVMVSILWLATCALLRSFSAQVRSVKNLLPGAVLIKYHVPDGFTPIPAQ